MFTVNSKRLNFKMAFIAGNLVLALFAVILFVCNCYPFGDNTFLMFDMKRQYVDYYSYLISIYRGENNPFYSFSTALGSGTYGFFVYYLTGPFLLLLSLFPQSFLPIGIEIVIGIKLIVAAFIMNLFLQRFFDVDYITVICAVSWSLSSFIFAHSMNMMWIDVVIMLPLVIWSFERFLSNNNFEIASRKDILRLNIPYIACVGGILYLNYYLSYQVLLFLVMWLVMRIFALNIKQKPKKILQIGFNTMLGILLDAVFLIPTAVELVNSPKDITRLGLELAGRNITPFEVFSKLGTLSYDIEEARFGDPQLFCGILVLVLIIMFFWSQDIGKRERIGIGAVFLFLLLSFCIDFLNLFWHAGMEPSGHPYRQAFLWIFLCILCSCRMLLIIKDKMSSDYDSVKLIKFIGTAFGTVALIYIVSLSKRYDHVSNITKIVTWGILIVTAALMCLAVWKKNNRITLIISILIGTIQLIDITANAAYTYNYQSVNNTGMSEYIGTVEYIQEAVDYIKSTDNSFYRMENLTPRQQNDAMQYGYNGVTHYSSAGMTYVRTFLQRLGYNDDTLYTHYGADNTSLADSILGIKYLLSNGDVLVHPNYSKVNTNTSEIVLENAYALPIAIGVNGFTLPPSEIMTIMNPFELQEDIISRITGEKAETFVEASASKEAFVRDGNLCCKYIVTPSLTGELYMYIENISEYIQGLAIEVNDEFKCTYGNDASMKVLNLGTVKAGDSICVNVIGDAPDSKLGNAVFVTEDVRAIEDSYHKLKSMFTDITCVSSSHLKIKTPKCEGVFLTVPYENGWEITVDGVRTKPQMIYDALMYIPINTAANSHYIDMQFTPVGFNLGLTISIITLGIILLLVLKDVGVMDED